MTNTRQLIKYYKGSTLQRLKDNYKYMNEQQINECNILYQYFIIEPYINKHREQSILFDYINNQKEQLINQRFKRGEPI